VSRRRIRFGAWNTGGFRGNASSIFSIVEREYDLMSISEAFLTVETVELVQFPSNFFYFLSPGIRNESVKEGRASGGILLLAALQCFQRAVM
jgi:hypothetical protein